MAGAKKGSWIGATVFGSVVIVVASWFLAINPTLSAASDVRAQTTQVKSQNDALTLKVAKLKADFAKLDDYKKQLGEVQKQIPSTAQLSDYLRQLDTIAAAHAVTVTSVTPGTPTAVVAKTPAVPAAQPTPAATGSATPAPTSPADGSSAAGTATGAAASGIPAGFTSIPMSVTVLGSYENTLAFLSDLQTATPRLFLVSSFTGTGQQDSPASGGKPKTSVGDQELVVTGFLFVLPDTAAAATPAPTATPALPGAVPGKNPLNPVGGK
ncbi:MAG: hypothetical protein BGO38_05050 [Cellulomonas sp. 73-145]|uniref:hypothetical protein n=1 Tax=Cellulomonas sp. 73-145 TaxID=1895739 RepID=UPI00092592B0|nr:hypothetical protein [Cellulomonas sp. 73-145]OJV57506.1 MAG: hypothetical protein BGO38_05050 [Cellulomonas sp. 73-145]